jgi:WD40 repeat protein
LTLQGIQSVLFINDATVVSGSTDTALRIWDIGSGACVHTLNGHTGFILCLALRDNLLTSGSNDTTVRIWDLSSGQCIHVLQNHPSYITTLGFNEDYTLLATGSGGGIIKIWRIGDGLVGPGYRL